MPPELDAFIAQLRELVRQIAREEVAAALAASRSHVALEYMSTAEAAEFARVHPKTIRRWISEGRLQEHGAGREIRVLRDEIAKLVRADGRRQPAREKKVRTRTPEEMVLERMGLQPKRA